MRARFVKESVNFERKKDPLSSLGVGKIHLIKSWLDEMGVENYTINDDLTIDVKGDVFLDRINLKEFPSYIKFNRITDNFYCHHNQLTSLVGCPSQVAGGFYCYYNRLTSLDGCPNQVGVSFYCSDNKVKFAKEDVLKLCKVDEDKIIV